MWTPEAFARFLAAWTCWISSWFRALLGRPPLVRCWLRQNPDIAAAIRWQFRFQTTAYDVPESAKRPYDDWSKLEQGELQSAFDDAWQWMAAQSGVWDPAGEGLAYPPANINNTTNDAAAPWTRVDESWARDLFVRWLAFQLVIEIGGHVPWSLGGSPSEELQVLFDSASIMSRPASTGFTIATGSPGHGNYVKRKDNLGTSLIAPPWSTYAFLANEGLIGANRLDTIGRLLQWVSDNCAHYFGHFNYGETDNHWQFRGNPPITRIIEGTTNPAPGTGFNHWTAGCHGTTGFLRNVLRAVNIPMQISTVCGHSQAVFLTENLYLDHGDNPYNLDFKATTLPASSLLIDHATYTAWFGTATDNRAVGCDKIGEQVNLLSTN